MPGSAAISVREAQRRIMERARPLAAERAAIPAALGRVLAEPIEAERDLPPWDNSAMDGYAVRVADVAEGTPLPVALDIPAGARNRQALPAGAAARIMTGAPLPVEADAVIPVEESIGPGGEGVFASPGESVRFVARPERGAHVRNRAEDFRQGERILAAGVVFRGPQIALSASAGHAVVSVVRRPRVAIVSTGDELVDIGEAARPGRIVNGNAYGVAAQVAEAGGLPTVLPIVPDDPAATLRAVESALTADAVVTIGGISAGARDHVRDALAGAGVELVFWKVALRPGGPMAFGVASAGNCVFGLPGNPVSALVTFELFVRPALLRMGGHERCFRRTLPARLGEPVRTLPGKTYYLRGRLTFDGGEWIASLAGTQGSGVLSSLARADGLLIIPEEIGDLPVGAVVDVLPIHDQMLYQAEVS
ncbi:molybdopterin molybdotransferase MoeA [soil metagenome]